MKTALTLTLAAFALSLAIPASLLAGPDDIEAAQDVADYSAALADGGVSLCKEFDRVPVWTKAGDLACRTAQTVAQGGQP